MPDIQDKLTELQIDFAAFRGRVDETLTNVATKSDILELKLLIEKSLGAGLSIKQRVAIITAGVTIAGSTVISIISFFS